jgi:hypothetical protein
VLRAYFTALEHHAASTQARKQASLAAFLRWCHRHGLVDANPMDLLDRTQVPEAPPLGVDPARVEKVLAVIPKRNLRDRVLFTDGRQLGIDNRTHNMLLRSLRCLGERGFALLTGRWYSLRHTTASPRSVGDIVRAALVLTQFEYRYLPNSC